MTHAIDLARDNEREACAAVIDALLAACGDAGGRAALVRARAAIRARGELFPERVKGATE